MLNNVITMMRIIILILLQGFIVSACANELIEERAMMNKNIFSKSQLELLPVYDEAIKREVHDGLRFVDFRKSLKPDYATEWTPDGGSDDDDKEVFFSWQMASGEALGSVYVSFFADFEAPLKRLYAQATRHTATFPLWGACVKDVGTVCAQSLLEERNAIMFTYKNVFVKVGGSSKLPDGTPLNEALAQWVFDQLKKAPKVAAVPDNIDKWEWLIIKEDDAKTQSTLKEKSSAAPDAKARPGSVRGGGACPKTGYWWTPAMENSRRFFNERETMPAGTTAYGAIIWQWDDDQKPS
jgi:hypothetical protein